MSLVLSHAVALPPFSPQQVLRATFIKLFFCVHTVTRDSRSRFLFCFSSLLSPPCLHHRSGLSSKIVTFYAGKGMHQSASIKQQCSGNEVHIVDPVGCEAVLPAPDGGLEAPSPFPTCDRTTIIGPESYAILCCVFGIPLPKTIRYLLGTRDSMLIPAHFHAAYPVPRSQMTGARHYFQRQETL